MKRSTLFPAMLSMVAIAAAFQSCDKIADKLNYDLPLQTGTVQISIPPTSDISSAHTLGIGSLNYNIDSFIKAQTNDVLGVKNIRSVKLTGCSVTLNNGSVDNNFQNLESASSSFYSTGNTTPYELDIPSNPDSYSELLTLPVDPNAELKTYMSGNTFTYTIGGKLRKATTDTLRCTVKYAFTVNVKA